MSKDTVVIHMEPYRRSGLTSSKAHEKVEGLASSKEHQKDEGMQVIHDAHRKHTNECGLT